MAAIKVSGEERFRAQKNQFAISPTTAGYTIAYSANGVDWTTDTDAVVPANENLVYLGAMQFGWYKMEGNSDNDVEVLV